MNREQAKQFLELAKTVSPSLFSDKFRKLKPIIIQFAAGSELQGGNPKNNNWDSMDEAGFTDEPDWYRIKPEPRIAHVLVEGKSYQVDIDKAISLGIIKLS